MGRGRVKLTEVNPHLVCVLCRGYLIDATTITECLHSFCRSCIILYLERKSYCPICEVQIHKTKPYLNLKLDKTLQDIVYKLVPGLFHNEMRRRQEFYKNHPLHDRHLHPEARGIAIDRLIYSPDDSISLSLEYYDKQREREEWRSVGDTSTVATHGAEGKRYLLCPAVVTMAHLKKFLRSKYNLPETATVEVLYRRESLPDSYSLMDVAYIYTWKQNEPMRFYYRIHLLTKCIKSLPELKSIDQTKRAVVDEEEEENENEGVESQIENTTEICKNNANKLDLIKQLGHSENILDVTESKRKESIKDGENNFISVNDRQINAVSKGLKSSLQTTKNNPHGNNFFQPFRNGVAQQQSILKKSMTLQDSTDKNSTTPKENISIVDTHETTRPVSAVKKINTSHCTETSDVKIGDLESSKDLNVKTESVRSNSVNISILKKETESHLKTVTVQNTVIEKKPASGNSLLRKETEPQVFVNETKNNKVSNRTAVNNSRTSYHSLSFMTADLMKPTTPSPKSALAKISEDINNLCPRDNPISKSQEVPSKTTAQRVNIQKNPLNGDNLSTTTTAVNSNAKKNFCMNSSCAKGIDSLAAKLGAKTSNHDLNSSNKIPSPLNSVLESKVLQNSDSAVSTQHNAASEDNKPKESTNFNSLEKNRPEGETDSKNKILLKDNTAKNNVSSMENHTSHIDSLEKDISSSKNPEGDSENTVHLDESSAALLSAIGLKPKPKTSHVKLDESAIEAKSISQESCEKHVDELDKNKNEFSVPGLSPFISEHDEISVSLLLGLSNGHTEKKPENLQSTTNEQVKKNEDRPATQFQQLDDSLKNNQTKSSLTASSPITNIQKVVNNIIPPAKKLPSKTIITHLLQERKTDFEIKNTSSDNSNQPVQINGFKVPLSPAPSDSRATFNGSRLCPSPRPKSAKQNSNVGNKIGKAYDEKELSTNSNKSISESYITNNSYRSSFKLGSRSPVPQSIRIPSPRHISVADRMLKSTKYMSPLGITSFLNNKDNSKTILANNFITKIENSKNIKRNGDVTSSQGKSESSSKTELKTEQQKVEIAGKELQTTDKLNNGSLKTSKPELKSSSSDQTAEVDASDSKVSLLKRKLNTQQNECDVVVSTATRDDSLSEAKKRRQVTPDVSIELLSGPLNERNSIKRPLFEYPSLTKKLSAEKSSANTVENNHTELRISSIDQLCASSVKIEKISSSQLNNNSVRNTVKDRHTAVSDGKTIEHLRPSSTKTDSNESKNNTNDDLSAPDITIEKMRESPKLVQKKTDSDCEIKVTKVAEVSATKLNNLPSTKRQSESPSSSSIIDSDNPLNPKKMPRLIEINAPPRPKLDPTFQERKHQKTGLKMTTVRKEVPIGKEVPLVRKDCNGPLDLSGKGTSITTATKQSTSSTTLSSSSSSTSTSTSSPKPPQQYSPSSVALQQFVRQHLELQFASHANNNLGLDWRKELFTTKHLEDWVRNAISCGALPPHPFLFNPAATPPSPHRK